MGGCFDQNMYLGNKPAPEDQEAGKNYTAHDDSDFDEMHPIKSRGGVRMSNPFSNNPQHWMDDD